MTEKNEEENLDLPQVKEGEEDTTDWKAEATKLREKAIAQRERTKTLREQVKKYEEEKAKPPETSNEPDYGRIAFLNSVQVIHPDDQKAVMEEANRLKLPLTDVLQMEHLKTKLKTNKEVREAAEGLPGQGNRSGSKGKDVDYWLAKGGLPDDQETAQKVVEARKAQHAGKKFADEMFNE